MSAAQLRAPLVGGGEILVSRTPGLAHVWEGEKGSLRSSDDCLFSLLTCVLLVRTVQPREGADS